jgi:protein-tyrosine phosphatase
VFGRRLDAVEVVPGLWLGSAPTKKHVRTLTKAGIDAVVDLRAEVESETSAWPSEISVHFARLQDHGTPSLRELQEAASIVRNLMADGQTVLVHCHAGLERAPTVACAALVLQGWSLEDAYHRIIERRPSALPTDGQLATLRALHAHHAQA